MLRLDPQHVLRADLAERGVQERHRVRVPPARDPVGHVLAADLVEVVAEPPHHRVLARTADAARERVAAFPEADDPARQALLADPAPPLVLVGHHLLDVRVDGVVERARLASRVARANHVTRGVGVLVGQLPERVPELMRRDQRPLRAAPRGRGLRASDPAVGERVRDREGLHVLSHDAERGEVGRHEEVVLLRARAPGRVQLRDSRCRRQRRSIGDAACERRGRAGVREVQPQRRVAADVAVVGVAADARVLRDDLQPIDVEVVPVATERLDAPLDVEVSLDVVAKLLLLVRGVAVGQDHKVQPLGRRPGDLDRHDGGASRRLGARDTW